MGRSLLPLDTRLLLYKEVLRLRGRLFTYREIISEIEEMYRVTLAKGTISGWVNGTNTPLKAGNVFTLMPTPALAYVIGTKAGDASLNVKAKSYQYRIRLQAVDREFVEAFSHAVAAILGCAPHRLWKGNTAREIHVEYGSYILYKFLRRPINELRSFIEHNKLCVAAFLRGFFDSEGSVDMDGSTTASNSDFELLEYVRYLLKRFFDIDTTGPHLGTRRGSLLTQRGKSYRRNADCFYLYVRKESLRKFCGAIGMTIERKKVRLERFVARSRYPSQTNTTEETHEGAGGGTFAHARGRRWAARFEGGIRTHESR